MQLVERGIAGTMESGDILVEIQNKETSGIDIQLDSTVGNQYGRQIKAVIQETLQSHEIDGVTVKAVDKGSLDCTIRARVSAAVYRGLGSDAFRWE